jgi:hypothetical protein
LQIRDIEKNCLLIAARYDSNAIYSDAELLIWYEISAQNASFGCAVETLNLAYLFVYDDMGQINRMDCRTALPRRIGYVRFSVFRMLQCNV